jgi:hypothetical protein
VNADARLNAGFLVSGDHIFIAAQGPVMPATLVEVQDPSGLLLELRIAGENPTAVLSGTDGVLVEPAPDGGATDLRHDATSYHLPGQVLATQPGEG